MKFEMVKDFLVTTVGSIVTSAKTIFAAASSLVTKAVAFFTTASVPTLVVTGLGVAGLVVGGILLAKMLMDKKASYADESNKSVVENAATENYWEAAKCMRLHPSLKKIEECMTDGLYDPTKNKNSALDKVIRKAEEKDHFAMKELVHSRWMNELSKSKVQRKYFNHILENEWSDYYEDLPNWKQCIPTMFYDDQVCKRVWDSTTPDMLYIPWQDGAWREFW